MTFYGVKKLKYICNIVTTTFTLNITAARFGSDQTEQCDQD